MLSLQKKIMNNIYDVNMTAAIILAGGQGQRFNGKKQFHILNGKPLWKIVYDKVCNILSKENVIVVGVDIEGGKTRSGSVLNGLNALTKNYDGVLIVEAARPLVTINQLQQLILFKSRSVTFTAPCVDTIILKTKEFLNRDNCLRLLTPQAFDFKLLKEAYLSGKYADTTDETIVMYSHYGIKPDFLEGGENLFKLTYPKDISVLEELSKIYKE
jgi:2-C-methyl-D-erythritol 4-phosphate cytidylyltransferase